MASGTRRGGVIRLLVEMVRISPSESAAAGVLLLVLTLTEGATLLLLMPLLELVGVVEENPLPRAAGWLSRVFGAAGVEPTLAMVLLLFVALAVVRALLQRWQVRLGATVRENLPAAYRSRLYRAMAAAEWRFLATRPESEFVHAIAQATGRVGLAATRVLDLCAATATVTVYLLLALRLSVPITALVLLCAAVMGALMRSSMRSVRLVGAEAVSTAADLHTTLTEHVGGLKLARTFGIVDRHIERFLELVERSKRVGLASSESENALQQQLELGSIVLLAIVVYIAAGVVGLSPPVLLLLLYIFARVMPRIVHIYRLIQNIAGTVPLFDSLSRLEHDCQAAAEQPAASTIALKRLAEAIVFDDVTFAYPGRPSAAVTRLSIRIAAGRTTAIVGASGAGKSTVADLILGLLFSQSGRVLIDGTPLDAATVASWREQIGYVPQDTYLFQGTVRENLAWAAPSATATEMWDALRLAAADRFVAELPQALDTVIGHRGIRLSGGERQRLAIARALLRRPSVLVLDEATSAVDAENERRIQQAIDQLQHRLTIVVITHRLSTISRADVIHVMEQGRIVQSGTWPALLDDRAGRFATLARATDIAAAIHTA